MIPNPNSESQSHLLLVRQDAASVSALKALLADRYRLTVAENVAQALQMLAAEAIDLVLAEVAAPHTGDYPLVKAIRQQEQHAHLPVILVYDAAASGDIAQGLEAGANDYITTPLDRQAVQARVEIHIQHKRLVDEHRRAIEELQSVQVMRNRFFNVASHDLKNPINNIRMAQFLLHNMVDNDATAQLLLENIDIAVTTMEEIVSEFLDSAALQGQPLDFNYACVDVEELLWNVMMQYNFAAHKKNIALRLGDADGKVRADSRRLLQVLSNLVSNAIKYSPLNKPVWMSATVQENYVRISVRDYGPGIPADERDKLFSEFGKLSTRPTGGENSTGLGLWIVKQLVTMQSGRVGVEFPAEGGSHFWVEMPIWTEADQSDDAADPTIAYSELVSTA